LEPEADVVERLIQWGQPQPLVRAMLLTSSRAVPNGPVDVLSDYDVVLILRDIQPFFESRGWLADFGPVLAAYRDPLLRDNGLPHSAYVTQYASGLKIDFTLWPVAMLQRIAAAPQLPPELDAGYRILLDKDHLADGLKPPTYRGYIPAPPTEAEYQTVVELFCLDAAYVARYLWRDDIVAAKHLLDHFIKQDYLRPMLEWHIELEHHWSFKPGPYGRRLKLWLRRDLWTELENTYTGAEVEANWEALHRTIALFRRVAREVGQRLGYHYPQEMDDGACALVKKVRELERPVAGSGRER
jgi:aminoglycoside 6-adenylyltransferase